VAVVKVDVVVIGGEETKKFGGKWW